ncbi:MAG: nitronate monooxygenase [Bacteroidetes bacterium CG18_big_fil_WC_8_21_14_2_50_41_14]|nr:MAG: nitronate monooxygenase [Bacteroidetes bacterium CG18_big_fil_WC_8_21_14_2_50_41_14]PJB55421.1 MAG: nitronate monooxygenase [Bacteroidetes bacterium CG_4_9_14_3_um_filter_41_19]
MNKVTSLFGIKYPIIQGGMIWCSGWRLASAVSNAGGLGLIGSGSMRPELLEEHIIKCKAATNLPFGVNIPLLYPQTDELIEIILRHQVKIVFTSAGNPGKYTSLLKENGITVAHVVANSKFALKADEAGVDAIVAEGFEAGGHNGAEETTTLVLIPQLRPLIKQPLIAAGGIASGEAMYAAMALGADGVQIGSLFASSVESSGHWQFKQAIFDAGDGATRLLLKKLIPVRLLKNTFFDEVVQAESQGASVEELKNLLSKGRAKAGMFAGDIENGELEIGQVCALIQHEKSAAELIENLINEFYKTANKMSNEWLL